MGGTRGRTRQRRIEYCPLPSQAQFHSLATRFKGFSGPIGSGKSQALCHEAIKLTYLNAGRMGLIGAPTYPMLRDATQNALFEILDANKVPYDFNKAENTVTMLDTNSRMVFRPVDDFDRLRGTNLAWFGVDELTYTPEEAWLVLEGRLRDPQASRLCGFAVWTPKGYDWVYERFVSRKVEGYEAVIAKPLENRYLLEKIPDFYERLRLSYDEKFYRQEAMGEYVNASGGRVYGAFERGTHVKPVAVAEGEPLLWALDFNVNPMCSVVAQNVDGAIGVVDEIVLERASTWDACNEFHSRFPSHRSGVVVYGDASGNHLQTSGTTDYQMIRDFFRRTGYREVDYRIPKANPAVRERVMLVNLKLRTEDGKVHLTVDPRCRGLIRDLELVTYREETNLIDKDRDPRLTHLSDALGYLVWQQCHAAPAVGYRSERLF